MTEETPDPSTVGEIEGEIQEIIADIEVVDEHLHTVEQLADESPVSDDVTNDVEEIRGGLEDVEEQAESLYHTIIDRRVELEDNE